MAQLLKAIPRLQSLEYHSHYDIGSGGRPGRNHQEYFDCEKLDNSLMHVQATLKRLVLSIRFSSLQTGVALGGFRGMKGRCKLLRHFIEPEALEIPILMLFGWEHDDEFVVSDLLPSGLQGLCLADDLHELFQCEWTDEKLFEPIETYLKTCSKPHGTIIGPDLKVTKSSISWCEAARTRLKSLCDDAGINSTILKKLPGFPKIHSPQLTRGIRLSRGSARGQGSGAPRNHT